MDQNDRKPRNLPSKQLHTPPTSKNLKADIRKLGNVILDRHGVLDLNPTFFGCRRQSWKQR